MNQIQGLFTDVKTKYKAYLTAKRKVDKWTGVALPAKAKEFVQVATHEVVVLENHLTVFNAILTRTKANTRFTKTQIKNMKTVIGMVENYISNYKNVVKAWMPYTKKKTLKDVSLPTYPVIDTSRVYAHVAFATSVLSYFDTIRRAYEKGANQTFNRPVLPFKRNMVNVRQRTIAQAKLVKRPVKQVRNMLKQKHANDKKIQQRQLNRAQQNVNQLSAEIQTQYNMRLINRKKHEALKVKTREIRSVLSDCLDQKQAQVQQIDDYIAYIRKIQQFLPEEYLVVDTQKGPRRNDSNNNVSYNV